MQKNYTANSEKNNARNYEHSRILRVECLNISLNCDVVTLPMQKLCHFGDSGCCQLCSFTPEDEPHLGLVGSSTAVNIALQYQHYTKGTFSGMFSGNAGTSASWVRPFSWLSSGFSYSKNYKLVFKACCYSTQNHLALSWVTKPRNLLVSFRSNTWIDFTQDSCICKNQRHSSIQ